MKGWSTVSMITFSSFTFSMRSCCSKLSFWMLLIAKYLSSASRYARNTEPKAPLLINFKILKSSRVTSLDSEDHFLPCEPT